MSRVVSNANLKNIKEKINGKSNDKLFISKAAFGKTPQSKEVDTGYRQFQFRRSIVPDNLSEIQLGKRSDLKGHENKRNVFK